MLQEANKISYNPEDDLSFLKCTESIFGGSSGIGLEIKNSAILLQMWMLQVAFIIM